MNKSPHQLAEERLALSEEFSSRILLGWSLKKAFTTPLKK